MGEDGCTVLCLVVSCRVAWQRPQPRYREGSIPPSLVVIVLDAQPDKRPSASFTRRASRQDRHGTLTHRREGWDGLQGFKDLTCCVRAGVVVCPVQARGKDSSGGVARTMPGTDAEPDKQDREGVRHPLTKIPSSAIGARAGDGSGPVLPSRAPQLARPWTLMQR